MDKGAHFYRSDFQVHTPRDNQWKGKKYESDEDRRAYADSFVAECRRVGLHAVAITDHHDFTFFPFIKSAAQAECDSGGSPLPEREQLVVFPGLELTLGSPTFQALLILDADIPVDRLDDILKALSVEVVDPALARLPPVKSIDHLATAGDLCKQLDTMSWLQGKYIVLPNVTDGGYKTMLRSGMKVRYRDMPCVGGYLDGTVETKVGKGNKAIFAGENEDYGFKRLALFQTSDSRADDFRDLGKHSTWIKWSTPTAEALRQACLSEESRISQAEPELPNVLISRIQISNSKFLGPVDVRLNQQYNAIIGGRGTGKSTILSYLRWALADEPTADDDEIGSVGQRQKRLIESTLKPLDARVDVSFSINGIDHVIRRTSSDGLIQLKVGDEDFRQVREHDVRALLPIHAYSQKQLSSVAVRIDELTRFITAPIKPRLDEIDREVDEASGRLRENYGTLRRARTLDDAIASSSLEIKSLATQAAKVRESLDGLSEADQKTLEGKPSYDSVRDGLRRLNRDLDRVEVSLGNSVEGLTHDLGSSLSLDDWPEELQSAGSRLEDEAQSVLDKAERAVSKALSDVRAARSTSGAFARHEITVSGSVQAFDEEYSAVKERSTAHEARLAALAELERRSAHLKQLRDEQRSDRAELGNPLAQHKELRTQITDLGRTRSSVVESQCEKLDTLSDGLIRASLNRGVGLREVRSRFASAVTGSGIRSAKIDSLFDGLQDERDPVASWSAVLDELEYVIDLESEASVESESVPTLGRLGVAVTDLEKVRTRLTADGWLDLVLTPVLDHPIFEYRVQEADYIDFSLASAGQQATALLTVLLGQPGMPLIVDQPEDDLDSQVILDIVERLWTAKSGRQIIFSSHNANLVVNGDAELVIVCDNRSDGDQSGGEVRNLGAIDVDDIRADITRIMEGGERAFKLRKEKYGF